MEVELIKVPAKAGCMGCWYEDSDACPAGNDYRTADLSKCADETGFPIIFIPLNEEDKG